MTPHQAQAMFRRERAKFARLYPDVITCRLVIITRRCVTKSRCAERDLAAYYPSDHAVRLTARALDYSDATVLGILRHELGHAADRSNAAGAERRADRIARRATGVPVRYTVDGLQNATHGAPRRPAWLHQ